MATRMNGVYRGSKARGSHTTIIHGSEDVVKFLDKNPLVEGIAPGFIVTKPGKGARNGQLRLRTSLDEKGVLTVKVIKSASSQEIRIYSARPGRVANMLQFEFRDAFG